MDMRNSSLQSAQFKSVPLSQINLEDDTFRITTRIDVNDLIGSIRHEGLINPPLLAKRSFRFTIVSGFRRIVACRHLGKKKIVARILDPGLSSLECLRWAIADNSLQRSLNLIETSRCLQKLSSFLNNSKQLAETASHFGLPANLSIINKIKTLCLLPGPVQNSILADTVSLSTGIELGSLEPENGIAFAQLFDQLKISLNKQREIIMLVKEIARREKSSIKDVLEDSHLKEIMHNKKLDRSQKSRKIRYHLRQIRFPRISKTEQNFESHLKRLKLGKNIKLIPPKEFESATYVLNLTFSNLSEFNELRTQIEKLIQHPSFKKILERNGEHFD
jgi:ParB family chromosome partitioning protein